MKLIQEVTADTNQQRTIRLDDGSEFVMVLYYRPMQNGWFMSLQYGDFILNNFRVTNSLNMLRNFRNIIPFGMACITEQGREPFFIEDFSNSTSRLFLLSQDEVDQYEDYISG